MSNSSNNSSVPQNVSMDVLLQAIQALELKNQALAMENRTLKVTQVAPARSKTVSQGTNSSTPSVRGGSSPTASDVEDQMGLLSVEDVKKLQHCAKFLTVFYNLFWEKKHVFGFSQEKAAEELTHVHEELDLLDGMDDDKRKDMGAAFKNRKQQAEQRISLLRIVAALYKCVPAKFHEMLEYDYQDIRETMKAAAKAARANFVYFGKRSATDIFDDIPIPYTTFSPKYNRVGDELCLRLLGYDKKKQRYAQCPEILYPVGQGGKAHSNIFRAPALVKLLSVTLHGQSSLQSNKPTKTTNGDLWEVTSILAGAIASAATVARYLLSHDTSFTTQGDKTHISYEKDCEFYIRMIESTLTFDSTIKTFEYYNENLFLAKKNHLGFMADGGNNSDDSDAEEDILRALRQPELDRETEANTSVDEGNLSVTLMPSATLMPLLRAKDHAVPVTSDPTYVDVSDDEEPAAQNNEVDLAPGIGVSAVSVGPPAQETIAKPARGRSRGSKKTTSGRGKVSRGTKGRGAGTSVKGPSIVPTASKALGGHQLRDRGGNKQNIQNSSPLLAAESIVDNVNLDEIIEEDLDESIEEDLEYNTTSIC
ncbi:hypothetical protein EDD18DRAFT_1114312 [Armillaria luteobubalina]|uniref:Uncharacterized protein n=1 Tax=Armillaria luteobubalina TaxID=153913 RepID=A0AA39P6I9_9AGAR|nr:hypothetical protein EDD18DRAFT_1114312 [Armillaria luteobubalina]